MKVQVLKLLAAAVLVGLFHAFGGFAPLVVGDNDYRSERGLTKAWSATLVLFFAGVILTLWGNSIAQSIDWDIPDGLYPALGVLLLVAGFIWMLMVRDSFAS